MPAACVLDSVISYKILPRVGPGRLLAPDLVGMGRSGKPDIPYLFADHARCLDAWFDALGLDRVVLIGHDWAALSPSTERRRRPSSCQRPGRRRRTRRARRGRTRPAPRRCRARRPGRRAGLFVRACRQTALLAARSARLDREADRAVAAERARIARELHDIVAHHLSVVILQPAGASASAACACGELSPATLEKIETSGRQALTETRRLLGLLRGPGESACWPRSRASAR